jgi:ribosome-binding factor A
MSRRLLKAAEAIREVVSMAILTELRDPRVKNVTVVLVEVAPDMKSAKIHVSVMGDEKQEQLSLRGLQNAAGFLQKRIADEIDTRYTPRLTFVLDKGVKNALEVSRILQEVLPKSPPQGETEANDRDEAIPSDTLDSDTLDADQSNNDEDEEAAR